MPIETEIKLRVASHDPVRMRLREAGGTLLARVMETNRILDRKDGALRANGCGLRIRLSADEQDRIIKTTLTFKGPRSGGTVKSREEIEVSVGEGDTLAALLNQLGYTELLWYQKRRERWRLHECFVELDQPPEIGWFVEIEGPDEQAIRKVQAEIGLGGAEEVRASYVRMLLRYQEQHGLSGRRLPLE